MIPAVTFVVGKEGNQKSFTVDSGALVRRSTYFRIKLLDPKVHLTEEIHLPEDDTEAFEVFVRYIETGNIESQPTRKVIDSFQLFNRYLMPEALFACRDYLMGNFTSETVAEVLEITQKTLRTAYCLWYHIFTNTEEVLKSAGFLNVGKGTVSQIICQDVMSSRLEKERTKMASVRETTVYKSLVEWGKKQCSHNTNDKEESNLRKVLKPLLCHIRFLLMTEEEFEEVCKDGILTDQETLEVLKAIRMEGAEIELPFLNLTKEVRRPFDTTMCFLECCKNSEGLGPASLMTLRISPKFHDLFIYGIILHDVHPKRNNYIITLKKLTEREANRETISQDTDEGTPFLQFAPVLFQKGELGTIVLQAEEQISCCSKKCDLHSYLERRADDDYYEFTGNAHFRGILALPVKIC